MVLHHLFFLPTCFIKYSLGLGELEHQKSQRKRPRLAAVNSSTAPLPSLCNDDDGEEGEKSEDSSSTDPSDGIFYFVFQLMQGYCP